MFFRFVVKILQSFICIESGPLFFNFRPLFKNSSSATDSGISFFLARLCLHLNYLYSFSLLTTSLTQYLNNIIIIIIIILNQALRTYVLM
ncbi:hypothetical protein Hanom_Chr16g01513401 [Helianthus anomalus]